MNHLLQNMEQKSFLFEEKKLVLTCAHFHFHTNNSIKEKIQAGGKQDFTLLIFHNILMQHLRNPLSITLFLLLLPSFRSEDRKKCKKFSLFALHSNCLAIASSYLCSFHTAYKTYPYFYDFFWKQFCQLLLLLRKIMTESHRLLNDKLLSTSSSSVYPQCT